MKIFKDIPENYRIRNKITLNNDIANLKIGGVKCPNGEIKMGDGGLVKSIIEYLIKNHLSQLEQFCYHNKLKYIFLDEEQMQAKYPKDDGFTKIIFSDGVGPLFC